MSRFLICLFFASYLARGFAQFGYNPCVPAGGWTAGNGMGSVGMYPFDFPNGFQGFGNVPLEMGCNPPGYPYPYGGFPAPQNPYMQQFPPSLPAYGARQAASENVNENRNVNTNENSLRRSLHNPSNENLWNGNSNFNSNSNSFGK